MKSLVTILKNTATGTWHPIYYLENLLAGGVDSELNKKVTRYKSQGHHTVGFPSLENAINSIHSHLIPGIKEAGYEPVLELESFIEWDGEGVPADTQLR